MQFGQCLRMDRSPDKWDAEIAEELVDLGTDGHIMLVQVGEDGEVDLIG